MIAFSLNTNNYCHSKYGYVLFYELNRKTIELAFSLML
jgi:hypothetical protein